MTPVNKLALSVVLGSVAAFGAAQTRSDDRVVLVLLDGLRWQEVYRGADPALLNKEDGGLVDVEKTKKEFWREDVKERRAVLMPFLWSTVAKQGQLIGDRDEGSIMHVSNRHHFSYPGYSEMICGSSDDERIKSNNPDPNPNVSVFEWLNGKPAFKSRVAVFGAWDCVAAIINRDRSKIPTNVGTEPMTFGKKTAVQDTLNRLKSNLHHPWGTEPYDAITMYTAIEYLKTDKPRAMWITFGETDEFAHEGHYDTVLEAAHRSDAMLKDLWDTLQSMKEYKGKTTLVVTVDHGRGLAPKGWMSHGASIPGADQTWAAVIGPRTKGLGVRTGIGEVVTAQIAATVAASVGEDYRKVQPKAAPRIPGVIE
jgi:hypothetical protein